MKGSCYCGNLSYEFSGAPLLSAYCHCTHCQRLSGCPFVHTVHVDAAVFRWTHDESEDGTPKLAFFALPEKPWITRWRCVRCGVCVAAEVPRLGLWTVWGAQLARDAAGRVENWDVVRPTVHIYYGTRMLDIDDTLGKWEGYEGKSERIA
ncbi:Mss4-like protein [Amylocystis lapponica]|nr:Mss4-like protein [Amylocystis lapponica]